ncbi:hypothetical protein EMPS_01571 [Entomortierella parvispora]|uniref:PHD-type domain-containing protein n=1 Tax=Entomortierella parvispora TaxID=205924 RepID=A0A9P3H328_9FUNG|nr:hypothetical protein EMPS_01571 [Entomortierella parvispora]
MDTPAPDAKVAPCICGSDDDIGFMICCDGCESWMHGPCVQITRKFSTGIDTYFCPRCKPSSKSQATIRNVVQHSKLLDMSDEILLWILSFVRCQRSIGRVSSTCRKLWRIAQDPYLWKHVTLLHDASLRRHWAALQPRLLTSNIYSLNLQGEIAPPVMIDGLSLERFSGLRVLQLQDIQTYTVYRLASKLPWLHVFEARKIKGGGEIWDWRPFKRMTKLEELLLWRNETLNQAFSLTMDDESLIEIPDDIYPAGDQGGGGFVQLSSPSITDLDEDLNSHEGLLEDDIPATMGTLPLQAPYISGSGFLPNLRRLALVNIVSASMDRGTDSVMRILMRRVEAFVYWNSFNILFPVVRTSFKQLQDLTLVEPSEAAWRDGTWQQHAAAFEGMKQLRTITMINSHISKRFLAPILDALISLRSLKVIRLISTEDDVENVEAIFSHVIQSSWSGTLDITIQDDPRDGWAVWCAEAKRRADGAASRLELKTRLFQAERDEVAGLKRLCLKAWQDVKRPPFIE